MCVKFRNVVLAEQLRKLGERDISEQRPPQKRSRSKSHKELQELENVKKFQEQFQSQQFVHQQQQLALSSVCLSLFYSLLSLDPTPFDTLGRRGSKQTFFVDSGPTSTTKNPEIFLTQSKSQILSHRLEWNQLIIKQKWEKQAETCTIFLLLFPYNLMEIWASSFHNNNINK